ncbi:MAG: UDP-N-acetylmuramoyl-tripeptide--D-alanyl-D-alanine ligase [Bacteroidales bacterium]|nr:UDP-N-acetylmuramoyl-tripeptide--D-alanyl-D-alanine ligase [Bacteroidales bacterium]
MTIEELYSIYKNCGGRVSTDSRAIKGGELFFALKGENFDGNAYAAKALEAGAAKAVVTADSGLEGDGFIPVEDTLATLQQLARYHRDNIFGPDKHLTVIGLTGTNGKTTTKELIREVLSKKFNVAATSGNLNNDIGVPLTILGMGQDTEIAVVEMGASHPDDIQKLVKVSAPDFGLITNVGRAHILGFGSFEGVKAAKGALYDFVAANGGTIFLNADDAVLAEMAAQRPNLSIVPYGVRYWDSIVLPSDEKHPFMRVAIPEDIGTDAESENLPVLETKLVGAYNATNALAAIAVGLHFGVSLDDAMAAIAAYEPANKRSQMVHTEKNTLIVDAYNANPSSMAVALESFAAIGAARKAVMLGQMGELGSISNEAHSEVVKAVKELPEVYLVGPEFKTALEAEYGKEVAAGQPVKEGLLWFGTSSELAEYIKSHPVENATVLIKGSRSQEMEKVIPVL